MAWPELRPLPSWSPAKFAILQGERTVWHKLAVDARNGWSDDLRGKLKELYKVELDRTTFDLEITEIPVLKWAELKRGREGPHDAPLQDSDDSITTVPLFRIRHASVKAVDYGLLYFYGSSLLRFRFTTI